MRIDVTEEGVIRLKEVFNSIILETTEGNRFVVCMRDDGLEIGLYDAGPHGKKYLKWFTARDGDISEEKGSVPTVASESKETSADIEDK